MTWVYESALKNNVITQDDINLIRLTDDIDEALFLLKQQCEICKK
jgi:hypothetical protein